MLEKECNQLFQEETWDGHSSVVVNTIENLRDKIITLKIR